MLSLILGIGNSEMQMSITDEVRRNVCIFELLPKGNHDIAVELDTLCKARRVRQQKKNKDIEK